MRKTKSQFIEYLNECPPIIDGYTSGGRGGWYMGGKLRVGSYGALLRVHDPIAFQVGYNEWKRQ